MLKVLVRGVPSPAPQGPLERFAETFPFMLHAPASIVGFGTGGRVSSYHIFMLLHDFYHVILPFFVSFFEKVQTLQEYPCCLVSLKM